VCGETYQTHKFTPLIDRRIYPVRFGVPDQARLPPERLARTLAMSVAAGFRARAEDAFDVAVSPTWKNSVK
jgi:hypothetical protein